ncbi:glycerophosphoryl diester phosphodiesterase membrane domain-containing protein [Salininema proteolyticum]|uniref:Glycerophosphoryl diester phosphodiesterase membrane domain-containing protein n=1 Tax=Salininema proteolyticum TaxID=1607685 RepID=A0ABV8TZG1_9ACTN
MAVPRGVEAASEALRWSVTAFGRHFWAWLTALLLTQGFLFWIAMPLLSALLRLVLGRAGIDGVNGTSIPAILSNPLATGALLLFTLAGISFIFLELALLATMAHMYFEARAVTVRGVLRAVWGRLPKLYGRQGPLLLLYMVLVLPLSHIGVASDLTSSITVPRFVSDELQKTAGGTVLYWGTMALIAYLALRLVFTFSFLAATPDTVYGSMRDSVRLTRRTIQGWVMLALVGAGLAASTVLAVVAVGGFVPVGLEQAVTGGASTATGLTLTFLQAARFVVAGLLAVAVTLFVTAFHRVLTRMPIRLRPREQARRTTRAGAVTIAVLAVAFQLPRAAGAVGAAQISAGPGDTEIIAHRGYTREAVENSVEALEAAAGAGADMVELDIQEAADGGLVVMHDTDLKRLAGVDAKVYEMTTPRLRDLTLRQNGYTARIPTLEEFVARADELGTTLLIEVKPNGHESPGFTERVTAELERLDPARRHWVQSLDQPLIEEIESLDPDRDTAFVVGFQLGSLPRADTDAIAVEDWSYDDSMLVLAHEKSQRLFVWTVNDLGTARDYLDRNVDGIITDSVEGAVSIRSSDEEGNALTDYGYRAFRLARLL